MLWTEYKPVLKIGPKGVLGSHEIRPIHSAPSLGQSIVHAVFQIDPSSTELIYIISGLEDFGDDDIALGPHYKVWVHVVLQGITTISTRKKSQEMINGIDSKSKNERIRKNVRNTNETYMRIG